MDERMGRVNGLGDLLGLRARGAPITKTPAFEAVRNPLAGRSEDDGWYFSVTRFLPV